MFTDLTLSTAAIRYAHQGFAIFPCWPNEKRPMTLHGFKDATCDEKQIGKWWKQWPDANIGLALDGKFWVLDVDHPIGEKSLAGLEAQHEPLPLTTAVRTGHGGRHIYFSAPSFTIKTTAGKLGHGIDVRGKAGYVLVSPSQTVAEYTWISRSTLVEAPGWLLALIKGPQRASQGSARPQDHKGHTTPLSRAYARSVLNGELSRLRLIHDMRRTGAMNLDRSGISRTVAKQIGGWKTDMIYERYRIVSEDDLLDASKKLNRRNGHSTGIVEPRVPQTDSEKSVSVV